MSGALRILRIVRSQANRIALGLSLLCSGSCICEAHAQLQTGPSHHTFFRVLLNRIHDTRVLFLLSSSLVIWISHLYREALVLLRE